MPFILEFVSLKIIYYGKIDLEEFSKIKIWKQKIK